MPARTFDFSDYFRLLLTVVPLRHIWQFIVSLGPIFVRKTLVNSFRHAPQKKYTVLHAETANPVNVFSQPTCVVVSLTTKRGPVFVWMKERRETSPSNSDCHTSVFGSSGQGFSGSHINMFLNSEPENIQKCRKLSDFYFQREKSVPLALCCMMVKFLPLFC